MSDFSRGSLRTASGLPKVRPSSSDCATMIASALGAPGRVNRRQATVTAPVFGSIAIVAPWLIAPSAALRRTGVLHVAPQFTEYENMMSDLSVVPDPVN